MKRKLLSMLLVSVMLLTLLPTSALAANTVTVNDYASLAAAFSTAANGDTIKLGGEISLSDTIATANSITLDLNGHTLTSMCSDTEHKSLSNGICFTGAGTFTVTDSIGSGKFIASKNYSLLIANEGKGTVNLTGGVLEASEAGMSSVVWNMGEGTVNVSGATLKSNSFYPIKNKSANGKLNVTSGTVSSTSNDAIKNFGKAEISGGTVSSETSTAVHNAGSGSSLTISGGTVKSASSRAIENSGIGNTVTVTGGKVQTDSGIAIANFNSCTAQISGGAVSSGSGMSVANMTGGRVTISEGAAIISVSGVAVNTSGNLAITGGKVSSDSNMALRSTAPAGSEVTVSGGTISSESNYSAGNFGTGKMTISGTAALSTKYANICLLNNGAGTAVINGGTFASTAVELYNADTGKIEINGGTFALVSNIDANGGIVINGGSIKMVQGTPPVNSAGTPLSRYGVTLTDVNGKVVEETAVNPGELTLTPAVNYGFNGVKTDMSGTVYLWLPSTTTNANYKSDSINISGGIQGGKTCVLPNFTARVKVMFDGVATDKPPIIYLSCEDDTNVTETTLKNCLIPDNEKSPENGGVYVFSGLDRNKTYNIWGGNSISIASAKDNDGNFITVDANTPNATVSYYGLKVNAGEGIDYVFTDTFHIQGASQNIQANAMNSYTFDKWVNTADGAQGTAVKDKNGSILGSFGNIVLNGKTDITAYAKLNTYTGTVTLNKDGAAWSGSNKAVTLSPSETSANEAGLKTASTDTAGKYSFADLSPLVTYYVWMDGAYTGQTVTSTAKDAVVDYYSVTLTKGVNINDVTVKKGGVTNTAAEFLKRTEITVTAEPIDGDYIFSRWQNTTGGALVTSVNPYTFTVNKAISLTAVGGATKYTATVTMKKDTADWTSSPRKIVLSTSATALEGTVTGTVSGNTYTFSNLPGDGNYYVWDAETVTCTNTNAQISVSSKAAALDYYTVAVTPNSNITAVTGTGEYLKGSNVTITATPADYYRITGTGWLNSNYIINNITKVEAITAATEFATYEGKVTVNKDGTAWTTDTTAVVTLSTDKDNKDTGKLTVTGAGGVFTFANLDPRVTYYIWANDKYTGQALSTAASSATVDYYTVSITPTNATVTGAGDYLAGSSVTLTATPSGGHDFLGWYSGGALVYSNTTFTIDNISSMQVFIAMESNTFDAVVTLQGTDISGRTITLQSGSETAISPSGGGAFQNLERAKTYKVLDYGKDTGFTVSKNAPNVTLQYYTVKLAKGTGIDSVIGGNTYLAGSNVTVEATEDVAYAFSGWSGTESSSSSKYTILAISKDYTLTANGALKFTGVVSIANGNIVIENDPATDRTGKIRITVNGTPLVDGDNLDPNTNIIITGTNSNGYYITVTATLGAYITLQNVTIVGGNAGHGCVDISNSAGNVTINLEGNNILNAFDHRSAIYKGKGENELTINGPGSLTAKSGKLSSGIGGCNCYDADKNTANITINGGVINATGGDNASGIGGSSGSGSCSNITINGGVINATSGYCGVGIGGGYGGSCSNTIITGGTITATGKDGGAGIGGGYSGINGKITITGGNIKTTSMGSMPLGSNGRTLTLEPYDWSASLSIVDNRGIPYGMNGVQAIDSKMYAYVDRSGYLTANTPSSITESGITASAGISPNVYFSPGNNVTVTVTLSGTALKPGTYTVGLTGTGIGTVATQTLNVTKDQIVNTNKTFTFTMPVANVSDLAVTLSFAETNKHTVSFKDGTTLLGSAAYYEGENYTLMDGSGLQKTGYTFGGWGMTGTQMSTSDVTRTAEWTPNTYKVVFHNDSTTTEQSFSYNAAATAFNGGFTKTGYSLSGWATTLNGPKVYNLDASVQNLSSAKNGTVDLYAVWQAQTYSVSFANGGGTGAMEPQSFTHGVAQELTPIAFTRTGYTFADWKDGATTYVNGQSVSATANLNLTAQWTANSYSVVFSGNGANGGTKIANQSFVYNTAQMLSNNTLTRTGYTFDGWATSYNGTKVYDDGASVNKLTDTHNDTVTLYAVWTANTYTVSFNANGGSGSISDQMHTYDKALELTENAFTRSGYAFGGWNTQDVGKGASYVDKASVKNLATTGSVTLYAQWAATVYSLAFNASEGVGSMDSQSFATGDSGKVSDNRFVKPGYTFDGWNTKAAGSGTDYAASAALMSLDNLNGANPTMYAKWTANSYTVVFNSNGGSESMGNQSFTYDEIKKPLTENKFKRGSDTFLGWSTSPTAETATYADKESVSNLTAMADGTVTLYAVWKASAYVVSFDANGGSSDMLPQSIGRSAATALSANSYNRTGYTFVKWNTEPDGSGVFYADKQEVTNLPGDTASSITLYAQWTENARYNLSGTVKDSDDDLLSGATVKLMQGSTVIAQTKTGTDGGYFFGNLKSGTYNLVASKGGKTVTTLVTITSDTMQNVVIPAAAANNSVLVVTKEPKAETPELTVGGLDDLAKAENADITMTVTAKAEDKDSAEQLAIKAKSGSQSVGMYLDMTIKKGGVTLDTTAKVLEIVVPFNFSGKTTVKVLRYHGGTAEELEQLTKKPTAPFVDGKCFLDRQAGLIHVYTSKFSTYAVSYTSLSSSGSGTSTFPVNIASSGITGGSVKSDKTTAALGDKVTITVTPDKGYKLTKLSVLDVNGKEITFTKNSDGTYTFTMPDSKVSVTPTFGKSDFPFVDVPENHWAYDDIEWAFENGLMNGTGDGTTFEPSASTTRGMIVTVLWRKEGKPAASAKAAFQDVSDSEYYAGAIAWAAEHKIVEGFSAEEFGPEQDITREQMAAILYRYAKYKSYDVSVGESTNVLSYLDAQSVGEYAVPAIQWACGAGLINGDKGKLIPQGNAERCQVAAILHRFCKNVAK